MGPFTRCTQQIVAAGCLLFQSACGGGGDPPREPGATFGVEPGSAMDTTPAGTPAPPRDATVEAADEEE
jgi:hypothetical protein